MTTIIQVCQSSTCRSRGSDATLVEIEELASQLEDDCRVETTGCLGYCNRGPAVATLKKKTTKINVKVNTFEKSRKVVEKATGKALPETLPPESELRLSQIRATKEREYLIETYQWNKVLSSCLRAIQEQKDQNRNSKRNLHHEVKNILIKAGYPTISPLDLIMPENDSPRNTALPLEAMPDAIENYVAWTLNSVNVVSQHSAIFSFETKNLKRGTPHPRGRGKLPKPVTWHVTMLGQVGGNKEGSLPWIERDYTPVSSALEWERGRCDILIKIYTDGHLTTWLNQWTSTDDSQPQEKKIWLSKPIPTLSVPSLIAPTQGNDEDDGKPASILLLLAGTGIVALPQIMAHREPIRLLGISTPKRAQLRCPIDLIHSCRQDDILLWPEIKQYCVEGLRPHPRFRGLRNYTLLLTNDCSSNSCEPPLKGKFTDKGEDGIGEDLKDFQNMSLKKPQRLNKGIVTDALERLVQPYRVIVSGPDSYNDAAREFLVECGVNASQMTILSA
mmetsp:Transcript_2308/g.3348  ORF Transcript_2308/g.3348 Transcript_2308/m.3348 type:complete len:503 (-) Transcript_2308:486-1994(-)|eukprot:CAMPEP_0178934894 /NCGR_PEP_ID=MMETSP0786-20121207/24174_1 /TAXON_ID=186022 /ORGANISM="Thalassionema frauenfeldii, Strain CCMP 1798" /LENGTH=502 /DNA_ID=CAMNT_0020612843 /DNA_START=108 /DNA_END=1616 /DNA_ORIENTATION=+